jgi:hypothetical protein
MKKSDIMLKRTHYFLLNQYRILEKITRKEKMKPSHIIRRAVDHYIKNYKLTGQI